MLVKLEMPSAACFIVAWFGFLKWTSENETAKKSFVAFANRPTAAHPSHSFAPPATRQRSCGDLF